MGIHILRTATLSMKTTWALLLALCYVMFMTADARVTKCEKERNKARKIDDAPVCSKNGKFQKKQCDAVKCWCVKARSGKPAFGKQQVPKGEAYDCKKRPTKCQAERFSKSFGKLLAYMIPECDQNGDYVKLELEQRCEEIIVDRIPIPRNSFDHGSVQVQSKNYPAFFWGSDNNREFKIVTTSYRLNVISPGLTGQSGTVSFQSATNPNQYLRHYNSLVDLEDRYSARNSHIFNNDATFWLRTDKFFQGFVSFESVNIGGHFIRHQNYRLRISPMPWLFNGLFKEDASFTFISEEKEVAPIKECWCQNSKTGKEISGTRTKGSLKC